MESKLTYLFRTLKLLTLEFGAMTSIHGVGYITSSQRTLFEKLLWVLVFGLSLTGCSWLIRDAYRRWDQNPVIISFDEKTKPIWSFPYPAVTICPETKFQMAIMNYTEEFLKFERDPSGYKPDLECRESFFSALHICNQNQLIKIANLLRHYNGSVETNCQQTSRKKKNISLPKESIFESVTLQNVQVNYSEYFKEMLTEDGICYTFNFAGDLFREGVFPEVATPNDALSKDMIWSPEKGYREITPPDGGPLRAPGTGLNNGLSVDLQLEVSNFDYLCKGPIQGFKVQVNTPTEYPVMSKRFIRVPLDEEVVALIKPQFVGTSWKLHDYEPARRNCYFEHERPLRYFRIYSQDNCELECLSNYTLSLCGCVKFSMPRIGAKTRVCNASSLPCAVNAEKTISTALNASEGRTAFSDTVFQTRCNCLPGCTVLKYDAILTQGRLLWRPYQLAAGGSNSSKNIHKVRFSLYFKDSQYISITRNEMYGLTDFVANCGGLLGLFMGVSLLSLVELIYFCTLRPYVLCHYRDEKGQIKGFQRNRKRVTRQKVIMVETLDAGIRRRRIVAVRHQIGFRRRLRKMKKQSKV
ncbi:pickpocket protein 28 [Culex quinquefasciatus]|uniref:pickpocket protein 28 n=1 Tax=Culex quinquefasciatus TaxID=7176 RepID=UPI0018E3A3DF|nr:pickpocket protein 28 [Culex quinquefasciatus]